eukprot:6178945-Pleurochrysis_carterae.AAC.1
MKLKKYVEGLASPSGMRCAHNRILYNTCSVGIEVGSRPRRKSALRFMIDEHVVHAESISRARHMYYTTVEVKI